MLHTYSLTPKVQLSRATNICLPIVSQSLVVCLVQRDRICSTECGYLAHTSKRYYFHHFFGKNPVMQTQLQPADVQIVMTRANGWPAVAVLWDVRLFDIPSSKLL